VPEFDDKNRYARKRKNGFLSLLDKIKAFLLVAVSIRATTPISSIKFKIKDFKRLRMIVDSLNRIPGRIPINIGPTGEIIYLDRNNNNIQNSSTAKLAFFAGTREFDLTPETRGSVDELKFKQAPSFVEPSKRTLSDYEGFGAKANITLFTSGDFEKGLNAVKEWRFNSERKDLPISFRILDQEKFKIASNSISTFTQFGIGISNPSSIFHVVGDQILRGNLSVRNSSGRSVIRLISNEGRNNRVITPTLEITGGNDIAEPFEISEAGRIQPGLVVVIDETNPGKLKLSDEVYDKKVAGIISGANGINTGISLQQTEILYEGELVALCGRVYVKANTSNGSIEPGDLLTSSSISGEAMKVTDFERAKGAVIGKAMSSLKTGEGFVLVLVSLQ
jgi:hypothetical protein